MTDFSAVQDRFRKIEEVVNRMLDLFETYEIHATWATVGLLHHESLAELIANNKDSQISYSEANFSPYPISADRYGNVPVELLTAISQIKRILKTPHQELASHTYAHYYTLEQGQQQSEFEADLQRMNELGKQLHHSFRSIVFPRNQVNETYLQLLQRDGYVAFRGNQPNKDWENKTYRAETRLQKIRRVLDAYFPISKTGTFHLKSLKTQQGLINIPASRFLRPCRGDGFWERRKLKRVKQEMTAAARAGTIYHLWWHPHNLTHEPEKSIHQLEEILKHFKKLQQSHQFESLNMGEIAAHARH